MMRTWFWVAMVLLVVLHHDFWWWGDRGVVLGFLPVGLAYHAGYSLVVALFWVVVLMLAWPGDLEAWAEAEGDESKLK
jgi:hypothetical protein